MANAIGIAIAQSTEYRVAAVEIGRAGGLSFGNGNCGLSSTIIYDF